MSSLLILIDVVGPVFLVAAVGAIWARRGDPFDPRFVALLVTGVGTPCLVLDSLLHSGVSFEPLARVALAAIFCHALALALGYAVTRSLAAPTRIFLPPLAFANTGNMGLPLTLFAFGEQGLGLSIAYFTIASLANFVLGQAIASGSFSLRAVARTPLIWAVALALALSGAHLALPAAVERATHLLAGVTVPLMLLSLGFSLVQFKIRSLPRTAAFALVRLVGGFAIGWLVSAALGLDGVARGVVVAQSAMPSAVYNYMFALRYENGPEEVAGVVVLSTLMSLALTPLFLATLI